MAGTRWYFRNHLVPTSQLDSEQATNLPNGSSFAGTTQPRWMNDAASPATGATEASIVKATLGQTAQQSGLLATFVSRPLAAQTINAQNWTAIIWGDESNAAANMFFALAIYVWRPSTGAKVGTIYDANTALATELAAAGRSMTVSGGSLAVSDGDVVVVEVWATGAQSMTTSYNITLKFAGTTDATSGGAGTASFIELATQTLTFSTANPYGYGTRLWCENFTPTSDPGTTEQSTTFPRGGITLNDAGAPPKGMRTSQQSVSTSSLTATATYAASTDLDNFFTSFSSPSLAAQTIAAQEWVFAGRFNPASATLSTPRIVLYVWRPGTASKVGTIIDASANSDGLNTLQRIHRFTGSSVTCQAGDILVLEIYLTAQFSAGAHDVFLSVGGTAAPIAIDNGSSDSTDSLRVTTLTSEKAITFAVGYSITAAHGTYALTGQDVTLKATRKVTAEYGSIALGGQNVALKHGYPMVAGRGDYALDGQSVGLKATRKIVLDFGALALSGQAVGLKAARKIAVDYGSYLVDGQVVSLEYGRRLVASVGSYACDGQAVGLRAARLLALSHGSYVWDGRSANLLFGRRLSAGMGAYVWDGQAVNLIYTPNTGYTLAVEHGSYVWSGQPVNLLFGRKLVAAHGSYGLDGQNVGLRAARYIPVFTGTYSLDGQSVDLRAARRIQLAFGSYGFDGQAVDLRALRNIVLDAGAYGFDGQDVGLRAARIMALGLGSYTLTGQTALFTHGYIMVAGTGLYVVTPFDSSLRYDRVLQVSIGDLELLLSDPTAKLLAVDPVARFNQPAAARLFADPPAALFETLEAARLITNDKEGRLI